MGEERSLNGSFPLDTNNIFKGNIELKKIYAIAMFMKYHLQPQFKGDPKCLLSFPGGTDWKSPSGIINAPLTLYTQPPTSGSCSVDDNHELSFGGVWQPLTITGPLQSSTSCRTTPTADKQPASCLSWNCSFPRDVPDQKKQENHIHKMHEQLMTLEILKPAVLSARRVARMYTR